MTNLNSKNLLHSIYPFFLTFIVGRLISQTDLIMASKISASAAAAFAIPVRVSIIDMIVAFSLAPVISVLVAEKSNRKEREHIVQMCITFTFYISLVLTMLGLVVYPMLVNALVPHTEIAMLATSAVTWLTLSIPMRLCYFSISMAIHGTGNGKFLPIVGVFNFGLNILLNYIFIYPLNFGFTGIYIATFITSIVSLVYAALILNRKSGISIRLVKLDKSWSLNFIKKQAAELSRVASDRVLSFVEIAIVASSLSSALLAFSIGAEFLFLLYTPFVAITRGAAIEITKRTFAEFAEKYDSIRSHSRNGFILLSLLSLGLLPFWREIAEQGYSIPDSSIEWWKYIFIFGIIAIPFKWVDSLQRASFQADKKIGDIAMIDIFSDWLLSIPILFIGINLDSPKVAFSFLAITPALKVILLHLKSLRIKRSVSLIEVEFTKYDQ